MLLAVTLSFGGKPVTDHATRGRPQDSPAVGRTVPEDYFCLQSDMLMPWYPRFPCIIVVEGLFHVIRILTQNNAQKASSLCPRRDKDGSVCRGRERKTPVATACPEGR